MNKINEKSTAPDPPQGQQKNTVCPVVDPTSVSTSNVQISPTHNKDADILRKPETFKVKEELLQEVKTLVSNIKDTKEYFDEKGNVNQTFFKHIQRVQNIYDEPEDEYVLEEEEYQKQIGKTLVESGGIKAICDVVVYCIDEGKRDSDNNMTSDVNITFSICNCILVNFSDINHDLAEHIVNHGEYLNCSANFMTKCTKEGLKQSGKSEKEEMISSLITVIYNVGQPGDHTERLRDQGFVDVLTPYLKSSDVDTVLTTLAALANIVNEQEASRLDTDASVFKFLMGVLADSLEYKRSIGWSAEELARVIKSIARSDSNKKSLVEHGAVPLLAKLCQIGDTLEQRGAVRALWTLSFNVDNQKVIVEKYPDAVDMFIRLRHSADKATRKACDGGLWNLREKLYESPKYKSIGEEFVAKTRVHSSGTVDPTVHVMISYQWACQKVVMKIRDVLRQNGIKVWMDVDDMQGSIIEAMSRAIEEAGVILMCYSKKYKDSDNCRSEAEYAHQKKKTIIPLVMERGYRPDGWLGFIIGAKLYYDFSGRYTFESKVQSLLQDLNSKLKRDNPDGIIVPTRVEPTESETQIPRVEQAPATAASPPLMKTSHEIRKWSTDDVLKWIDKYELSREQFKNLTGKEIAFLHVLNHRSPDIFYKTLTKMLKIDNLLTMADFVYAIENTDSK